MAFSVFDNKEHQPEDSDLVEVLAETQRYWDDLKSTMAGNFQPLSVEWGFSGKKWGWSLRLKQNARTVLYLTPRSGHFVVGFALGQKAVDAAHATDLPRSVLEVIDAAPKYAEGRGVRLEVRTEEDLRSVVRLADVKMAN